MTNTPRQSSLGALRANLVGNNRYHGSVVPGFARGAAMSPALSTTSSILACAFQKYDSTNGEGIICRRTTDANAENETKDFKEYTSFLPGQGASGGAGWCPTNNKFYIGTGQHGTDMANKGMVLVFDPSNEEWDMLNGFAPSSSSNEAGRAFYVSATGKVWVYTPIGSSKAFAVIDPADNSFVHITDAGAVAANFTLSGSYVWTAQGNIASTKVSRIDVSTLGVSTVVDKTIFETWLGTAVDAAPFGFGAIEHIGGATNQIWVGITYRLFGVTENRILRLNVSTGAIVDFVSPSVGVFTGPPDYMWYTAQFDRIIFGTIGGTSISRHPSTLASTPFGLASNDFMTARKGCDVTSISRIALPVLTGPGGGRYNTVKFYSASDIGA
jgi:hypothetical protein